MVNLYPRKNFKANSVAILGSTGSVGVQTVDIVRELGLKVELLAAGENVTRLAEQIKMLKPSLVSVSSDEARGKLITILGGGCPEIITGENEILSAVENTEADIIFHSVAGLRGLSYALSAAKSGKRIGMANKEAIISAGEVIFDLMKKSGGEMIPVDSEHSAIYRCLAERDDRNLKKIILTASGGPFVGKTKEELERVTPEEALAHPTWKMGKKITIDSATLMNKGFEIIEAVKLFGVDESRVDVLIHRQSIIHSMIEYNDNTLLAQMGLPDMRDCIRYAATAPNTAKVEGTALDLAQIGSLTFAKPDTASFPLLTVARDAIRAGGTLPTSLIAADEEAVDLFLAGKIGFCDIPAYVTETLSRVEVSHEITEETVAMADCEARRICRGL